MLNEAYETEKESRESERSRPELPEHFSSTYELKPNESYEANRYQYRTDERGRIKSAEGQLELTPGKRSESHQLHAGGEDRRETDEGGHLIGSRFGGSEKIDNITAMDKDINRGEYKKLEDHWQKDLENGNQVYTKIKCNYEDDSMRPSSYDVRYRVEDAEGRKIYTSSSHVENERTKTN